MSSRPLLWFVNFADKYPIFPCAMLGLAILNEASGDSWFAVPFAVLAGLWFGEWFARNDKPEPIDIEKGTVEDTFRGIALRVFAGEIYVQTVRWGKGEDGTNIEVDLAYPDKEVISGNSN